MCAVFVRVTIHHVLAMFFLYTHVDTQAKTKESSAEQFFNNGDPFFDTPARRNPSFEEGLEQFFDVAEEDRIFKKEKDVFDKMVEDEAFFFKVHGKGEKSGKSKDLQTVSQYNKLCNCQNVYCGCCYSLKVFGKDQFKGCMEIEYVSRDFAMFITVSINGHIIITRVISGRNPMPFCTTTPYIPLISFCIRLYDIHHNPHGLSLCMRLEVTSMRRILFSISFDCILIDHHRISFYMPPNATTFGVVGFHLGDTDPYVSYQDWTKLHIPLPEITTPPTSSATNHQFLWFHW